MVVDDTWNPSKLCMSCMIRGWMLDDERSDEALGTDAGFVLLP